MAVAVPIRAVERNRRVAASVLAGGLAYRLFLWLLPFGLIVGGALGLSNARNTEDAVKGGGVPAAISNAIGDASRSAHSSSWWLLAVGVPLLLWAGFTVPRRSSSFMRSSGTNLLRRPSRWGHLCSRAWCVRPSITVALSSWFADVAWHGLLAAAITIAPLTGLWLWVSLHLPHRDAPWRALLPGALLIGIGVPLLSGLVDAFLVDELAKSTSMYGGLGATATLIFFIYLLGLLVVGSPFSTTRSTKSSERRASRPRTSERRARRALHPHETGGLRTMNENPADTPKETRLERWLERWVARAVTPRGAAIVIASATIAITFIAGTLMTVLDRENYPTIGSGLWWAVQTTTTVGYGDNVPTSYAGRFLAAFVMLVGIGFLTVITAAITSTFVSRSRLEPSESDAETSISEQLRQINARLERIETRESERS